MEPNRDGKIGDNSSISKLTNTNLAYQFKVKQLKFKEDSIYKTADNDNHSKKIVDVDAMNEAKKFDGSCYKSHRDAQRFNSPSYAVVYPDDFEEPTREKRRELLNTQIKNQEVNTSEASCSQATAFQTTKEFNQNDQESKLIIEAQSHGSYEKEDNEAPVQKCTLSRSATSTDTTSTPSTSTDTTSTPSTSTDTTSTPSTSTKDTPDSNATSKSSAQPTEIEEQNGGPKLKNDRPLRLEAATYELEKFSKKAMLIINQENIDGFHEPRLGTKDDVKALKKTFENLGFDVKDHKDKTIVQVFSILKEFSERDFTDYGCIAVAILTHGTRYGLLRAKDMDQMYSELTVLNYFKVSNNPTLLTKPIILIIQACRGEDNPDGFPVNTELKIRKDLDGDVEQYYLPLHSDTLVLHSSFYGKPAFRPDKGSWLIQTLCEKLDQLAPELDLISIITEVQYAVAIHKQSVEYSLETTQMEVNKQMPVLTSTLIRKLYLTKPPAEICLTKSARPCKTEDDLSLNNIEQKFKDMKASCSCFLEYFNYLRDCLSNFVEENPADRQDSTALHLLNEANTINENNYDISKTKITLIAISNYLENKARLSNCHKYINFYKVCRCI